MKEDIENKRIIGEKFIKMAAKRIRAVLDYNEKTEAVRHYIDNNRPEKVKQWQEKCKYNENILFSDEATEPKFFKLLNILVKGQNDNIRLFKAEFGNKVLDEYLQREVMSKLEAGDGNLTPA